MKGNEAKLFLTVIFFPPICVMYLFDLTITLYQYFGFSICYIQGVLKEAATPSSILLAGEILKLVFSWLIITQRRHGTAADTSGGQFRV